MSVALTFSLAPDLTPVVAPGLLVFDGIRVVARDERMDPPIVETEAAIRGGRDFAEEIARVRAMYKRLGLDPTKVRPSSEALLRRVRKGDPLPRVNSLVDICNWCSVETQLPFGLYDVNRIEGDAVSLRVGAAGEGYDGIRKDRVNVDGRLTLADARGPFGNPTSDSARTMVTLDTTSVLFVIYCPREHERQGLAAAMDLTARRMLEFARAGEVGAANRLGEAGEDRLRKEFARAGEVGAANRLGEAGEDRLRKEFTAAAPSLRLTL